MYTISDSFFDTGKKWRSNQHEDRCMSVYIIYNAYEFAFMRAIHTKTPVRVGVCVCAWTISIDVKLVHS